MPTNAEYRRAAALSSLGSIACWTGVGYEGVDMLNNLVHSSPAIINIHNQPILPSEAYHISHEHGLTGTLGAYAIELTTAGMLVWLGRMLRKNRGYYRNRVR